MYNRVQLASLKKNSLAKVESCATSQSGATSIEYGLLAAGVGLALIASASLTSDNISSLFFDTSSTIGSSRVNILGDAAQNTFENLDPSAVLGEHSIGDVQWKHANQLPGWDMESGSIDMVKTGYAGSDPDIGDWIDMSGSKQATISKELKMTDGQKYTLSFDANDRAKSGKMEVYFGGELIDTVDNNSQQFENYSYDIVGGSGDGSNKLTFKEVGSGKFQGTGLANIKVGYNHD